MTEYVSDDYARAFEEGALAALDHITDEREDLEDVTMRAAEKIGHDIDVMLGRDAPREKEQGRG